MINRAQLTYGDMVNNAEVDSLSSLDASRVRKNISSDAPRIRKASSLIEVCPSSAASLVRKALHGCGHSVILIGDSTQSGGFAT